MRYVSTRGSAPDVGFAQALLGGLAPDGGLYMPAEWPALSGGTIASFAGRPYADVAAQILGPFVGDEIDDADLALACEAAYRTFSHKAVAPLRQLGPDLFLLELFHGPSLAFKDVAMQLLARLYEHVLGRRRQRLTIVCATSGDTGGAAVEAFAGRASIDLVALFPEGRISEVQRRFMTTADAANVRAVAVAGDFDDCQAIVKGLFRDHGFANEVSLSAVNSINFARIAAQSVYYFTAAAALGAPHREVSFVTPTGNFGDAFAGWAAWRMGLPIASITVATNANDILARALATGRYERAPLVATSSPAMDIQSASNFERLVFEASGRDAAATRRVFETFDQTGGADLDPKVMSNLGPIARGARADEGDVASAMRGSLCDGGVVDPHTAVAIAALDKIGPSGSGPRVVLSTAHPAKFPDAVLAATGAPPAAPAVVARMTGLHERFDRLPADAAAVKAYVRAFASR
jgi:threonine synthase